MTIETISRGMRATSSARRRNFRMTISALLSAACLLGNELAPAQNLSKVVQFDIKPQPLDTALLELGSQAKVRVMFATQTTKETHRAVGIKGAYPGSRALADLLEGTHLKSVVLGDTVEIVPRRVSAGKAKDPEKQPAESSRKDPKAGTGHESKKSKAHTEANSRRSFVALQQVIVTGTHINGGPPPSTPIISITRREIEQSGYQTVEQVMDSLPENFASVGSSASGTNLSSEVSAGNIANGVSVDLMGLGSDSTLVLVNGHRLAPSGTSGAFTDVSVIPLDAIKRIDVMTDGASAIYGADAIGGVVNYILRSHEQGADTSLEYGSVTRGGMKDYRASQSAGMSWSGGSGFVSYEFHKATPLLAADRPYTQAVGPWDLMPGLTQNSVYGNATNAMGAATVEGDVFFSRRTDSYSAAVVGGVPTPYQVGTRSTQFSVAAGSSVRIPAGCTGKLRIGYGGNNTDLENMYGTAAGRATLLTLSGDVSGRAVRLKAGPLKFAVGGQVRRESFESHYSGEFTTEAAIDSERTVGAVFGEARVPLLASARRSIDRPRLALDLAARYERYSDFGSSLNGRAGVAWTPVRTLHLRATWSTSFKPPNFYELYGSQYAYLENTADTQSATGVAPILEVGGSNPDLKPERSAEWTAGFDFMPLSVRGITFHVTYFQIRFRNRIASPNVPYFDALQLGGSYASFIQQAPSTGELAALTQAPAQYFNTTIYPGFGPPAALSSAMAVLDNRLQNIGLTRVAGLDSTIEYAKKIEGVGFHAGVNAAYLFRYQNVPVAGAEAIDVLSTLENPVNLRVRGSAGIGSGRWSFNGALNYVNHYSDPTGEVPIRIASWTTLDLQLGYRIPVGNSFFKGLGAAVSCTNCLDAAPPSILMTSYLFGYDPTNASPVGRFVSLALTKRW